MTNEKDTIKVNEGKTWEQTIQNERLTAPLVDLYETGDDFTLVANMPGVSKENIRLKIEEGSLTIFGKINLGESTGRKYLIKESEAGNYYRKFNLSNSIDETKIEANYENGQLLIKLPKHDRIKPRTINIK